MVTLKFFVKRDKAWPAGHALLSLTTRHW